MIVMILGAVFMLAVSIFIHELGHLLCGKLVGVEARYFFVRLWKRDLEKKNWKNHLPNHSHPDWWVCSFPWG